MIRRLAELARRGWGKPPRVVARWLARQVRAEIDQRRAPAREAALTEARLLRALGAVSLDGLWQRLADGPFPAFTGPLGADAYENACPGDTARVMAAAEAARAHRVDLLGSGAVELGTPIDWHRDFKSGHRWPADAPFRRLDLLDLGNPSDVKVPWELSRLQWLIPLGQAYVLTGDDRYANAAKEVIDDWIAANPLGRGVNWACTMDVALRGITLVWLFAVFNAAPPWADGDFQYRFLKSVYLHGDFTRRHLEWSDVNGNHLLADAAGLVVMGLFLGQGAGPRAWADEGWRILKGELPRQVTADGVDFEVSASYQRLAAELFVLPALCRGAVGLDVPASYRDRLRAMAAFIAAYSRPGGATPLWGDADDGRVLPFGGQAMTDHRYLVALVGLAFDDAALLAAASGPAAEVLWLLGPEAAARIPAEAREPGSRAFADGGVYVMRAGRDHVFIDAGPVGMAGRGGHGHNDCLAVDAVLDGVPVLTDCGAYVYSADAEWRNSFRSTAFHNTPMIDGEEINRFAGRDNLWTLRDDARPDVRRWQAGADRDILVAAHSGYERLAQPVTPVRAVLLDKAAHRLVVFDRFEGAGDHNVRVPCHFPPGAEIVAEGEQAGDAGGSWRLRVQDREFLIVGDGAGWQASLGDGWVSPRYGVKEAAPVLNFIRGGELRPLAVALMPADGAPEDPLGWLRDAIGGIPA